MLKYSEEKFLIYIKKVYCLPILTVPKISINIVYLYKD